MGTDKPFDICWGFQKNNCTKKDCRWTHIIWKKSYQNVPITCPQKHQIVAFKTWELKNSCNICDENEIGADSQMFLCDRCHWYVCASCYCLNISIESDDKKENTRH